MREDKIFANVNARYVLPRITLLSVSAHTSNDELNHILSQFKRTLLST